MIGGAQHHRAHIQAYLDATARGNGRAIQGFRFLGIERQTADGSKGVHRQRSAEANPCAQSLARARRGVLARCAVTLAGGAQLCALPIERCSYRGCLRPHQIRSGRRVHGGDRQGHRPGHQADGNKHQEPQAHRTIGACRNATHQSHARGCA